MPWRTSCALGRASAYVCVCMCLCTGTFTKSFGSCGGYIAADKHIIDYLRRNSPAHLYATAMAPGAVQQVVSALKLLRGDDGTTRGKDKVRDYYRLHTQPLTHTRAHAQVVGEERHTRARA